MHLVRYQLPTKPPVVLLSARGKEHQDTFAATTRSVTTSGCIVNIQRVDLNGNWAQKLELDWIALPSGSSSGTLKVGAHGSGRKEGLSTHK